jgi:hypothetical protein
MREQLKKTPDPLIIIEKGEYIGHKLKKHQIKKLPG